jgi:hypothetical protein
LPEFSFSEGFSTDLIPFSEKTQIYPLQMSCNQTQHTLCTESMLLSPFNLNHFGDNSNT